MSKPAPTLFGEAYPRMGDTPSWFKGGTNVQRRRAQNEMHPMGRPLHKDEALTCRSCANVIKNDGGVKVFYKCRLVGITHGPATDIRLRWRACKSFETK